MSTAARAGGPARRGFILLWPLLLASCVGTDWQFEPGAFNRAFTDAVLRRDFDAVYPLVRATINHEWLQGHLSGMWMSFEQPVGPDDWAVLKTGSLLAGEYEYLVNPQKHPEDYDDRLKEPSLLRDRFRAAVVWLRRAADRGVIQSGEWLGGMYENEFFGVPKDDELAKCFNDAARSRILITVCRRLEQAKGYDPGS